MSNACCEMQLQRLSIDALFPGVRISSRDEVRLLLVTLPLKKISGYRLAGGVFFLSASALLACSPRDDRIE